MDLAEQTAEAMPEDQANHRHSKKESLNLAPGHRGYSYTSPVVYWNLNETQFIGDHKQGHMKAEMGASDREERFDLLE